jgi:hypothetical protein
LFGHLIHRHLLHRALGTSPWYFLFLVTTTAAAPFFVLPSVLATSAQRPPCPFQPIL